MKLNPQLYIKYSFFIMFFFVFMLVPNYVLASSEGVVEIIVEDTSSYYETISDAIAAAPDNTETTLILLNNITLNAKITIPANKKITIDGNNTYSITYFQKEDLTWYTGQLFDIQASASLTLKNLVINGNNNYSFDKDIYQSDLTNNISVETTTKYITSEENKPNITDNMIKNAGTLILDNVTIKDFLSTSSKSLIAASAGTTTTIKDTNIIHCASTGGGLVVNITGANAKAYIEGKTNIEDNFVASNGGIFKIYSGSVVEMNNGTIKETRAVDSNGVIAMTYGTNSTFILNGGLITNNSGVIGKSNGRNAPFYVHSGSKFIMNGGVVEYNYGTFSGGVDTRGSENSDVELNGGTIQYNEVTLEANEIRSDVNILYDYDVVLGKDMTINGNIYVKGNLVNNGNINGNIVLDLSESTDSATISGEGTITGDVIIIYFGEEKPVINEKINITGRQVSYETTTQAVARFEYNGGLDLEGYNYDLAAVSKEDGTIDKIPIPTKEGHTFINWYSDKELTIVWENSPVTSDITLYADWEVNEYNVTFNIDGKEIVQKYKYGDSIVLPEIPMKEGYIFNGWSNYTDNLTVPANDLTITASFKKIENPKTGLNNPYLISSILIIGSIAIISLYRKKKYI